MTNTDTDVPYELHPFIQAAFDRKIDRIVALDVGELTAYTDHILIITAGSPRQVTAVAEHIHRQIKETGTLPLGSEGVKEGHWALLDYGQTLIHVFDRETGAVYDLEGLWSDAPRLDLSAFGTLDDPDLSPRF